MQKETPELLYANFSFKEAYWHKLTSYSYQPALLRQLSYGQPHTPQMQLLPGKNKEGFYQHELLNIQ